MGGLEGEEELDLCDVVDMRSDKVLDLPTVRLLQGIETPNIKWLG